MSRVLIVEDEAAQLQLACLHFETAGYQVVAAGHAIAALEVIAREPPDLVVADVAMPGMDGYALLAAIRANAGCANLPVVFLTALDPSVVMPKARALGVSEVLLKPLQREMLLAAAERCLAGIVRDSVAPAARDPGVTTALRVENFFSGAPRQRETDGEKIVATVLFADIRNFTTFAERLSPAEAAELSGVFLEGVAEHIGAHQGRTLKTMGDGLLAVFQGDNGAGEGHAARALKTAVKSVLSARRFCDWVARRFPGMALPEFAIGIGVHTGELLLCQLTTETRVEQTVIGDTVNIAARLEGQTKLLGWSVVASAVTLAAAGPRFVVGQRASVSVKGRNAPVEVCELAGLSPRELSTVQNWRVYRQFTDALTANSEALCRLRATDPA